jgi:hypothetical protein
MVRGWFLRKIWIRTAQELLDRAITVDLRAARKGIGREMRSPHKVARLLLAFVVCSTIYSDYWEYSRQYHVNPETWMDVVRGTADAPQQYRIGVAWAADLMRRHGPMGLRHGFTLIDLFCAAFAVFLLFSLFERSAAYRAMDERTRWFGAACFVFLTQYYFAWITWYQRPETMASVAVLAATLWLLTVRLPLARTASIAVPSLAMLALAAMQGFIRPDVVFAMHLGILLVCLTRAGEGFALPRGVQAATSVLAMLIAGGIQFYLMHVAYPHAGYGTTPMFQLLLNLTHPLRWIPFALFMMPWAWVVTMLARRRSTAQAPGLALVAGSAIYVVLWVIVGSLDEVRIFLPYAVAVIPLTCVCAMERFAAVEDAVL